MGKKTLSVLQVGKYYPPVRGGIETHLELLARGLQESGEVDLEVLVADEGRADVSETLDGVRVRRLGTLCKLAGAPICPGLRPALRRSRADLVHVHVPHPTALAAYLASGFRGQLVCTYHSDIIRQRVLGRLIGPLQHAALRRARAIIVAAPDLAEHSPVLARHRERCVTIPFGLHPELYGRVNADAVRAVRERCVGGGGEGGGALLLAVGRLVYYKGFEFLLQAMAGLPASVTLAIIGDGPLRPELEREIARLGLHGRVHLLGNVPDVLAFYQACDVFVLPSVARSEAFGIVQLEAMACGKPVINTRLPTGVPFVSRDGETGFTVEPRDPLALAGAIQRLLADEALRERFGQAARERVRSVFSAGRMVADTLSLYRRVLDSERWSVG